MKSLNFNLNRETSRFFIFLILSLALLSADKIGILNPVHNIFSLAVSPVKFGVNSMVINSRAYWDLLSHFNEYSKRQNSLSALEKDNSALQMELGRLTSENKSLRKQLESPLPPEWKFQPVSVLGISRNMEVWGGSNLGIKAGMSVVDGSYYVGRVVGVSQTTALVMLANDPDSIIPAKTNRNSRGAIIGSFGEKIFLSNVLQKDQLFLDDLVVTSGEGGIAPNLIIGKIRNIEAKDFEVYKKGEIAPSIVYPLETTVFVVIGTK